MCVIMNLEQEPFALSHLPAVLKLDFIVIEIRILDDGHLFIGCMDLIFINR
jgi:hypothetical protein